MLECRGLTVAAEQALILPAVDLRLPRGRLTALLGPSGAGKTTLLRAIAGLQPISAGSILLGGEPIEQLPAHRRGVGLVFQQPRLLPHLSVVENIAFPLRLRGTARRERAGRARALLDDVGLAGLAERSVRGLSGGEQQRVALARALCAEPRVLLLDEPLSALDPARRDELRGLIARVQRERELTTLLVTHDRGEAAQLGDTLAVMLEGRIVQHGQPRELFERPTSPVLARFLGMRNLLRGTVRDGRLALAEGTLEIDAPDGPALVAIRPEHVRLRPDGQLQLRVHDSVYAGSFVRLELHGRTARIEAHVDPDDAPPVGALVDVELPRERLWPMPDREPGEEPAVR
ncbi:MAG TPA: ABC transporter ATP-binding protein [Solirubrobacteraceae bacterium]|nr:ABC transporter ATP-binding protein [Solirubrobacteraceae bacterium]